MILPTSPVPLSTHNRVAFGKLPWKPRLTLRREWTWGELKDHMRPSRKETFFWGVVLGSLIGVWGIQEVVSYMRDPSHIPLRLEKPVYKIPPGRPVKREWSA